MITRHQVLSREFLKGYATTMRPYLLFISGITGIAGMSFVADIPPVRTLLVFIGAFFSYGFGQALTDCFQIDTDTLSAPYRPLTQGIIHKVEVLSVSVVGLLLCISVFALLAPLNIILGIIAGGGLATYTFFKRRWWGGPWYNAWIVVLLCVMSLLAAGGNFCRGASATFVWTLLAVLAGYANFVLSGYFKDIAADTATGYRTLPVVFGRRTSAAISDVLALFTVASVALAIDRTTPAACLFMAGGTIATAIAQVRLHNVRSDAEAHAAIAPGLHGYILLLSAIAASQKPGWAVPLFLFYAGFVAVLTSRPAKNQI